MKKYSCIKDFKPVKNSVVTIGTFDGVHLGHLAVFNQMKEEARKINGETVVITFFPHPRIVLGNNNKEIKFIKTEANKIRHIENAGIDHLIIVEFTKEFALKSSEEFVKDMIMKHINPAIMIVGYDHHFGREREGSFEKLTELGHKYGFEVKRVDATANDDVTVSSTKIRELLREGQVKEANRLLGHEYSITGKVIPGKSLGRNMGFPTANIEVADEYKLIAKIGVYACRVLVDDVTYFGMSNIGYRPTVDHDKDASITIEVNIFDFDRDIYKKEITISFVERIRDEKKFGNIEALIDQLGKDRKTTIGILGM